MIKFSRLRSFQDANLWALVPVMEVECRIELSPHSHGEIRYLTDALSQLIRQEAPADAQAELLERIAKITTVAELLAAFTLGLQQIAGCSLHFTKVEAESSENVWNFAVEFEEEVLVRDCLQVSRELCLALVDGRSFDLTKEIERLRDVAYFNCLGPSTRTVMDAARSRGIPVRRLGTGSLLQLGHGARQRRVFTGETDQTGAIAETIAHDKELTRELLQKVGVPVPRGRPATDPEDAWSAVEEFGGPIVVKPRDANHGRGVSMQLTTKAEISAAFDAALKEGYDGVLVEEYIEGDEYRLLVVNDRLAAAARREPAQVRGDGKQTIAELVAEENRSPLRGDGFLTPFKTIEIDSVALTVLEEQGFTPESIPSAATRVYIRRNINYFNGGTAVDVTRNVHPDVAACAVEAARMIGLDIAGIDLKVQDISRPLYEQRGTVIEVNAGPGLQMHLPPSAPEVPVGEIIVSHLFPSNNSGRIPLIAVFDEQRESRIAVELTDLLTNSGSTVGVISSRGEAIAGRSISLPGASRTQKLRAMLLNSSVEIAVLETNGNEVRENGFGFDRCSTVVFGPLGSTTSNCEAIVRQRLIETLTSDGYLVSPADGIDAHHAVHIGHNRIVLYHLSETHPTMAAHSRRGGQTVFLRNRHVILKSGEHSEQTISLEQVPALRQTESDEELLAAIAGAWSVKGCSSKHPLAIASPAA